MHKFDQKNMAKLDSIDRVNIMPKDKILNCLNISNGDLIADIGCGTGYISFEASKLIGDNGKIYAIDTSETMLSELKKRISTNNSKNIIPILSDEYNLKIDHNSVNAAIMIFLFHEIENKILFLSRIKEILRKNGQLLLIDWEKKETKMGPPIDHRISFNSAIQLLKDAKFTNIKNINLHSDYFTLLANNS